MRSVAMGLWRCLVTALLTAAVLVGCGGSTDRKANTVVTFPGADRVPDLIVHLRQEARSDQVEELTRDLTLQVKVVAESVRTDFEARRIFVFLRRGATP